MRKSDIIVIVSLIVGIGIGLVYDFQIAQKLYFPNDLTANIINDYANFLAYFLGVFALIGLSLNETNIVRKSVYETTAIILVIVIGFIAHLRLGFELVDTMAISFILAYSIYFFSKRVKAFKTKDFHKWFMFILLSFIALLIFPNLIKTFILRFRPYMYMGGCLDYSFYLKWLPFNFEENFRSFPSFHVAMSALLMVFYVMPKQSEKSRNMSLYRAVLWIGIVSFNRMVIGAHFLSDTLVSILLSYIIIRILYIKIVK